MVVLAMAMSPTFLGIDCIGYVFLKGLPLNAAFLRIRRSMDLTSSYIADFWTKTTSVRRRIALRSDARDELVVPRNKTTFGDRSFSESMSGSAAWNATSLHQGYQLC